MAPWRPAIRYRDALHALSARWPRTEPQRLWWDAYHRVFQTRSADSTMRALYGRGLPRCYRGIIGAMRRARQEQRLGRWIGPSKVRFALPPDAVLIPIREGLLVASAAAKQILKLDTGQRKPTLQQETQKLINVLNIATQAGINKHLPVLLDQGATRKGVDWVVQELAPNTHPFWGRHNARPFHRRLNADWFHWLQHEIFPVMEHFYEASSVKLLDADHVLEHETETLPEKASADVLRKLLAMAERARPARAHATLARAMIHADLMPYHVHRDGTSWKLLDWEMAHRREILWEIFGKYLWHPHVKRRPYRAFWAWLRGEPSPPREGIFERELHLFLEWRYVWRSLSSDPRMLRYQILVLLLRGMRTTATECKVLPLLAPSADKRKLQQHPRLRVRQLAYQLEALDLIE